MFTKHFPVQRSGTPMTHMEYAVAALWTDMLSCSMSMVQVSSKKDTDFVEGSNEWAALLRVILRGEVTGRLASFHRPAVGSRCHPFGDFPSLARVERPIHATTQIYLSFMLRPRHRNYFRRYKLSVTPLLNINTNTGSSVTKLVSSHT
jgi:hypothetical protein